MNKEALTRHDIYRKLVGFSEKDLEAVAGFIDRMRSQKQPEDRKLLKLEGSLKGYDIDLSELTRFKEETWRHVEEELRNG